MKELKIVLVEDDEWDIDLMSYSLKKRNIPYDIEIYNNGIAAARFFEKTSAMPDIIILDLNLPGIAGAELLKQVKTHPLLQHVPVLILTTADNPEYIALALRDGAAKFLTKPVNIQGMNAVIDAIVELAVEQTGN